MPTPTWDNLPSTKQAKIVDAALHEFGGRGFSAGSLNVIARKAGIAKGSLFQYFGDKSELYAHVVGVVAQRIRDAMEFAIALRSKEHADFFELIRALMGDWITYMQANPLDRSMLFAAELEPDAEARRAIRQVMDPHYSQVLGRLVDNAIEAGQLRPNVRRAHLMAWMRLLFPVLAMAPFSPEVDPFLSWQTDQDIQYGIHGHIEALRDAYGPVAPADQA